MGDNWGTSNEHYTALEASLQRCQRDLDMLHKVRAQRYGTDPRLHHKPLATEDTHQEVEILEARMACIQRMIDDATELLPHTPPSPTVNPQDQKPEFYLERWGDRSTWKKGRLARTGA